MRTIHHVLDVVEVVVTGLCLRGPVDDPNHVSEEHQDRLLRRTNETRADLVLNAFRVHPLDVPDVQASPFVVFPEPNAMGCDPGVRPKQCEGEKSILSKWKVRLSGVPTCTVAPI